MSVLYRALWSDEQQEDPDAYLATARQLFSDWVYGEVDAETLTDGSTEIKTPDRIRNITVRSIETEVADKGPERQSGVECVARDVDESGTTWTTVLRVVANVEGVKVWVENRVETDDISLRISVGRPRLVDDLIAIPGRPHLGGSGLFAEVQPFPPEAVEVLVEFLRSPERTLPVIVCSEPGGEHDDRWLARADRIARRAGGIATVVTLDSAAVTAFRQRLGDLAVWGGGVRVYTPGPVEDASDGWRHRYTLGRVMADRETAMIDRIVQSVAQMSGRRPVPDDFTGFTTTAPAASGPGAAGSFVTEEEAEQQRLYWESVVDAEIAERNELEREYATAIGHLDRLRHELEARGLHDVFWGSKAEVHNDIPDQVQDTSSAVLAARMYLTAWLQVHDEAERDLDGIDTAPNSYAWGNTTWRGLRALAAYAESRNDGFQGGFWEWCQQGGPTCWPATDKKLSMTESESVQNNRKLSRTRCLPVSTEVDPSGEVTMWSHLKIAEGGGDLAPRVYFYDDTAGSTKKVHIGFVGPHYLMPNTKS